MTDARNGPTSRLLATAVCLWAIALATPASGQPIDPNRLPGGSAEDQARIPDILPGPATLRGRIVHPAKPDAGAGAPVILYALSSGGAPGLRTLNADETGRFVFPNIPDDPETVYLVGARYKEVPFGTRVSFEPGQLEREIELSVADPTTDVSAAAVDEVRIRVDPSCTGVYLRESHVLVNESDRVLYIPQEERGDREPILRVQLPVGAGQLESTIEDNLEWDGRSVSFWGPLRPGREELVFAYGISSETSTLRVARDFEAGARIVRLLAHPQGPALKASAASEPLATATPIEVDGVEFGVVEATDLAPGDRIDFEMSLPELVESQGIESEHARIWLEFDGAALSVDEQHRWKVAEALTSESGAPLVCMTLPEGANELLFSAQALALGLSRDPSGALAVRGPIPAGAIEFALRYQLPRRGEGAVFERELPLKTPLLSVLVADTGLVVETDQLHRRRFAKTNGRTYMHLEGFEIQPGAPITIGITPMGPRPPISATTGTALAAVGALLAIGFLVSPLRSEEPSERERPMPGSHLSDERDAVLATIRALEDDFETGKIDEEAYESLRQELRAEAVNLLRDERRAKSVAAEVPAEANAAIPPCQGCGAPLAHEARFCSQCGTPVDDLAAEGGTRA